MITKQIFSYYNTIFSLEMTPKVGKVVENVHLHKKWPPMTTAQQRLLNCHGIEPTGLWDITGSEEYMRNVIGSLYLDGPICLPISVYGLKRQHFSAFECSCEMHKLPGFVASQSFLMTVKGTCPTLSAPTIITISYVSETKEKKGMLLVITPKHGWNKMCILYVSYWTSKLFSTKLWF